MNFIRIGEKAVKFEDIYEISDIICENDEYFYYITLRNGEKIEDFRSKDGELVLKHKTDFVKTYYLDEDRCVKSINNHVDINGYLIRKKDIVGLSKIRQDYPDKDTYIFEVYVDFWMKSIIFKSKNKEEVENKYDELLEIINE